MTAKTIQTRRKGHALLVALGLAAMTLSACSSYRPAPPAFHEALNQPYMLDAGDRVRITVFEQSSLTNTYNVDQAGYIAFPLVGSIPARGKTSKQLEGLIASKLRGGYLRDPDVSVEIDRYRPIFVMGEVGAAGQYSYVPGMTAQRPSPLRAVSLHAPARRMWTSPASSTARF